MPVQLLRSTSATSAFEQYVLLLLYTAHRFRGSMATKLLKSPRYTGVPMAETRKYFCRPASSRALQKLALPQPNALTCSLRPSAFWLIWSSRSSLESICWMLSCIVVFTTSTLSCTRFVFDKTNPHEINLSKSKTKGQRRRIIRGRTASSEIHVTVSRRTRVQLLSVLRQWCNKYRLLEPYHAHLTLYHAH